MDTQLKRVRGRLAGPLGLVLLLVLVQVLVGATALVLWSRTDDVAVSSSECGRYRTVEVAVAPAMFGVVSRAAVTVAPVCTRVEPTLREGSQVALGVSTGQPLPDVWISDAHFWMSPTYLGRDSGLRLVSPSLARTPVLLVGGQEGRRFPSWGEAEASGLVSVPDPSGSSVGSLAVIAPQTEAVTLGLDPALARQRVVPFAQSYGERHSRGLDADVAPASVEATSRRLVVATEQQLVAAATDATYLRDLTPAAGAPVLDFPLAVRSDAPPGSRVVARGLARYFTSDVGVAALREAGLREPGAPPGAGLGAQVASYLPAPRPRTVAETVQSWRTLSVPSSILAVVDASGSMDFATAGGTRMQVLADAAGIGLSFLPDHARVGLWIFSIDKGGPGRD